MARNVTRVLLPLSVMNRAYMGEFWAEKPNQPLASFLEFVDATYDDEAYAAVQRMHLSPQSLAYILDQKWASPEIKYLDFPFWASSKLSTARRLDLHRPGRKRILDIGAGPGHLGVVARHLGHDYLGLDVPMRPMVPGTTAHIFDDLCGFFGAEKVSQRIEAGVPLRLPGRFDAVFCLMGTFNGIRDNGRLVRAWSWEEWTFLLRDLLEHHLHPGGRMYFQMSRDYLPDDVWAEIEKAASEANATTKVFTFDDRLREYLRTR